MNWDGGVFDLSGRSNASFSHFLDSFFRQSQPFFSRFILKQSIPSIELMCFVYLWFKSELDDWVVHDYLLPPVIVFLLFIFLNLLKLVISWQMHSLEVLRRREDLSFANILHKGLLPSDRLTPSSAIELFHCVFPLPIELSLPPIWQYGMEWWVKRVQLNLVS